ncbi:MAG: Membrane-fusion protein [Marinobacter excellens HL-55]|uniref:Membrane-fusion protein n=1 Tax=Marinobacter excellens HL-55 TaxID=1305731 RepID=A0A0P7ZDP0_9GAMM|nr:MAG: Membrane-fusion protein [Marinobacter excellens HL-55]
MKAALIPIHPIQALLLITLASFPAMALAGSTGVKEPEPVSQTEASINAEGLPVETIKLRQETGYERESVYVGPVEAGRRASLGFEISGGLIGLQVDEGDRVKVGDLLAELDTQRLDAARVEATASLEEARVSLALTEATLGRVESALAIRGVSQQELDEARQARDTALATLTRFKAALKRIEVDLSKSRLRAPFSGIIVKRWVDEGQVIATGTPVLDLQEEGTHEVRIALANELADRMAIGQSVDLEIQGQTQIAKVKAVLPVRDRRGRTVDVLFNLDTSAHVRPGDLAELRLTLRTDTSGSWVPLSALTETVRGLWSVYTLDDQGQAQRQVVDILYQDGEQAYVRGHIVDGLTIVADGVHRIVPGQRLQALPNVQTAQQGD